MPSLDPGGVLAEINRIWREAAADEIAELVAPHFTEDAIVVAPSLARVARGRAAVAASYGDFVRSATVLEVTIDEPQIDSSGNVAIATMPWRMRYEFGGRRSTERGFDTYVFRREGDAWQICWRLMISAQEEPATPAS
jgi:ketosteroid isomerase-like protein